MTRTIDITLRDVTNKKFSFDGLQNLITFLREEFDFWNEFLQNQEDQSGQIVNFASETTNYETLIERINAWVDDPKYEDNERFTNDLNNLVNDYHRPEHFIWSKHPFITVLKQIHTEYGYLASDAFINIVIYDNINISISNRDQLIGSVLAYEYLIPESDIKSRIDGELDSLYKLREKLYSSTENFIGDRTRMVNECENSIQNAIEKYTESTNELTNKFQALLNEQEGCYKEEIDGYKSRRKELEDTYSELLRLKEPAQYWSDTATKLRKQGERYVQSIAVLSVIAIAVFIAVFIKWLESDVEVSLDSLQGVIIFGVLVAAFAYLLRVLSRLAFSSFHLMRDAEQREQLTYLFLSLLNESAVDENAKEIVYQSLFSRSETGLLSHENGPIFPTIGESFSSLAKKK